jgi:hypothetical protein
MKKNIIITIAIFLALPAVAFAEKALLPDASKFSDVTGLILKVVYLLMQTLFAVISLAVIYIAWKYIVALNNGDGKSATEYRKILIGSIIGLAISFSLWGIISIFSETIGWGDVGIPQFSKPEVQE